MDVFDSIITGLNEAVDYEKGKGNARTVQLTVAPVPDFTAEEIKALRQALKMTQSTFAALMGVSSKTVEAWEAGRNHPDGAACRLLAITKENPSFPTSSGIIAI